MATRRTGRSRYRDADPPEPESPASSEASPPARLGACHGLLLALALPLFVMLQGGCATAPPLAELTDRVATNTSRSLPRPHGSQSFELPPGIGGLDHLSVDSAVAIALWNNAAFHESLTTLGFQRADLLQAGQLGNPSFVTLFPAGPKQFQFTALLPVEAFWLRPRRVAIARIDLESASQQLVATGLDLVCNVRIAFAELELAEDRVKAAARSAQAQERLAEVANKRFQAGDIGGLESAQARVAATQSRQILDRFRRDEALARDRLKQWMGLESGEISLLLDRSSLPTNSLPEQSELFRLALAARPELRANELAILAAQKRGTLSSADAFLVGASIDIKGAPTGTQTGPGLNVTLPVLNQNQGGRARAEATANQLVRRHLTLRDRIQLEVREAVTRREHALRELELIRGELLPALAVAAAHAHRTQEAGDSSPAVFLEAERRLADAEVQLAEAVAEVRRAEADLARAIGRRFENP